MSGSIHVNTDLLRELGNRFVQESEYAQTRLITELQHMTSQVESDWHGISRQRYDELFQHWCQSAASLCTWGEDIGHHLFNTAQQFDSADQS